MTIRFAIMGVPLKADLLVADDVDEFMLGFDWLTTQKATWDFNAKTLSLHGLVVPLCNRPSRVTAPILAMSLDVGTYTLDVDASNWAAGAVLQQEQEGVLRVIGYASKAFTGAEQRYCITRKELAAMIFGMKNY